MAIKHIFIGLAIAVAVNCVKSQDDSVDYTLFDPEEPAVVTKPSEVKKTINTWQGGQACGANKKCVIYNLCSEDGEVITDGRYMINERLDDDFPKCPSQQVCCLKKDLKELAPDQKCKNYKTAKNCGFRNKQGIGTQVKAIVPSNIRYSQYGEFPWSMAVMNVAERENPQLLCGGTLIHPKIVITKGITVTDVSNLLVRGGEFNTQTTNEICPHVDRRVKDVLVHEDFVKKNLQNSIAMIVLTQAFELSPTINIICLPPPGMSFVGDSCIAVGWGKSDFMNKTKYQVFPKFVELDVISNGRCQEMLRDTRLGPDFILHENFLCAGGDKDVDVCTGDGGSALFCGNKKSPGHYYFAAVIVGGIGCGMENVPGLYSDVSKHRNWIDRKMGRLNLR